MPSIKQPCPVCCTDYLTKNMPEHIMTHHRQAVRPRQTQPNHCCYAYVVGADGEEVSFCVCLTCKRGTMSDGYEGNGSRWITMHAKSKGCRAAHGAALAALREELAVAPVARAQSEEPTPLADLWTSWKAHSRMRPYMEEIETSCKDMSAEEEDPVFDPAEGLRQVVMSAIGYKKEVSMKKEEMEKMVVAHEEELITHRDVIRQHEVSIRNMMAALNQQNLELAELRRRTAALEKENTALKESPT